MLSKFNINRLNISHASIDTREINLKNILILTRSYPPYDGGNVGHSVRIYYLSNYLAKNAYNVYVLFFHELIQDRECPQKHKNVFLLNHFFEKNKLNFNDNTDVLNFCFDIINKKNISTIISSSPPLDAHLIAQSLKLFHSKKIFWICDLRDITSSHPNLRAKHPEHLLNQKEHELSAVAHSDVITTVSIGAKKAIENLQKKSKNNIKLNEICIVENGYVDLEKIPPQNEFKNFVSSSRNKGKIILVYAGTGVLTGDIESSIAKDVTLIFDIISKIPIFRKNFAIIIQGNVKVNSEYLKFLHPELSYCIFPRTDNRQMRANLGLCDIGFIVNTDSTLGPIGMAGKLYEYISCGLCLLQVIPNNSLSRLEFAKKHNWKPFTADAHNNSSIIETLYEIIQNKNNLDNRRFTYEEIQPYNRYRQYDKIIDLIKYREKYVRSIPSKLALDKVRKDSVNNSFSQKPLIENLKNIRWNQKLSLYKKYIESIKFRNSLVAPKISIIVISWRLHPDTIKNFQILEKQRDQNFELIFVDNGGKSGEFEELKPYIDTYVRLNTNTGAYLARNIGAVFAKAPILFFLEDDGIPAVNIVQAHLDAHEKYDVIAVRGVYQPKTKNPLNEIAEHYYLGEKLYPRFGDLEGNVSYNANIFFQAEGWDDNIKFGHGGIDLCYRLLKVDPDMRKQIYSPAPVILHDYAVDENYLVSKRKKQSQSWQYLRQKHGPDFDRFLPSWDKFIGKEQLIINTSPTLSPMKTFNETVFLNECNLSKSSSIIRSGNYNLIKEDILKINWVLSMRCNYSCSYCTVHDHTSPFTNFNELMTAVNHISKFSNKKIKITLSGGEPTIHPEYRNLIEYLIEKEPNRVSILTITNLSMPEIFFKKLLTSNKSYENKLTFVSSYHVEHALKEKFIKRAMTVADMGFNINILLIAHPKMMQDIKVIHKVLKKFSNEKLKVNVKLVREKFGSYPDLRYTDNDYKWFNKYHNDIKDKIIILDRYDNNTHKIVRDEFTPDEIIVAGLNRFKGMFCNAGINMLSIHQDGTVNRAVCFRGKIPGENIFDQNFNPKLFEKPVVCPFDACGCLADLGLPKYKKGFCNFDQL
ncbi:glycosyltransferase [Desulfonatronovibrio magnus]|uniref:glycosyltransferase n=1 Tax=Desulfonatronovibrio magnus TaxID=698827 RepID=UPI0005EB5FE5|nr:radical SAM protein [Desulfonatronovibrio magnus]